MAINNVILNTSDKFIQYKYSITEFYIIIGENTDKFPIERIESMKIEHYFEEASFPIFKFVLSMEPSRYYNIINNKDNVKFKVRIQCYYKKEGSDDKSMLKDVVNDTFILFPNESNEDFEKDLKIESGAINDINELDKINNSVELFLFKESIVNGIRSSLNAVLCSCNMSTAVTYMLYKAGAKNVLMSPFENNTVYDKILLPPQSIEKQIKFLNNNYGFYKNGAVVYFGLYHSYILNYKPGCTAWYNGEWTETVIYVLEKSNTKSFLSSTIDKSGESRYYYNATTSGIDISNATVSSNVLTGIDAYVIDPLNNISSSASSGAKAVGNVNSTILFNTTSNEYMGQTYTAQQKANSAIITLALEGINIDGFNPNKTFSVIFENATYNSKYKGNYRISTAIYSFSGSEEDYSITAAVTLKKVN